MARRVIVLAGLIFLLNFGDQVSHGIGRRRGGLRNRLRKLGLVGILPGYRACRVGRRQSRRTRLLGR